MGHTKQRIWSIGMKNKPTLLAGILIVLFALWLILKNQPLAHLITNATSTSNNNNSNNSDNALTSGNRKSSNLESTDDGKFSPFAKLPLTTKKTYTYRELETILRLNTDFTEPKKKNTCDYHYNDDGKIVKIEKNKGLYPSVSKWTEVDQRFSRSGFQIKTSSHLPYDINDPALKNLYGKKLFKRSDSHRNLNDPLIPTNELEIFPCQFVFTKETEDPEYFGIEAGKVYDGVFVVESSGERYDNEISRVYGAEGIPWEQSLWRHYSLFGFMEYKKHPELPRLLPEGTLYCREVKVVSVYELRTDK